MYILFLGLRYLHRRISALAALLAVTFGVATLFTVLSVMEGYKVRLRELVRGLESHLTILSVPALSLVRSDAIQEEIRKVPHVSATAPFIETIAMYKSLNGFSFFRLRGIDPEKEGLVGDFHKHLLRPRELERILPDDEAPRPDRSVLDRRVQEVLGGDRRPLSAAEAEELFSLKWRREVQEAHRPPGRARRAEGEEGPPGGLVVGINLLLDREVFIGDELTMITILPDSSKPVMESFIVVGAFKSGDFETDSRTALAQIVRVQDFLGLFVPEVQDFRVEGIRISLDDYRNADRARSDILRALARASAGRKVKDLVGLFGEVAGGFTEERIEELAEDLRRRLRAGDLISADDAREAVREAAALLAAAPLKPRVAQGIEAAFEQGIEDLGRGHPGRSSGIPISEISLLSEMVQGGEMVWGQELEGKSRPATRMPPGEALKLAARTRVLMAAEQELSTGFQRLAAHPLEAQVSTWEEQRRILIQAVEQEKWIVGFLVFLLNLFIGCVVLLMLVLLVIEKTRDIGVLLALGAKPGGVVWIFLAEGLVVVAVGVVLGLLAGYFFIQNINHLHDAIFAATGVRLFDPEIYQMDRIPTTVNVSEVVLSIFPSVLFGFVASLVPAIWASHQDPIKAIHYE